MNDLSREQRATNFTAGAIRGLNRRVAQLEHEMRTLRTIVSRRSGESPSTKELPSNVPDPESTA